MYQQIINVSVDVESLVKKIHEFIELHNINFE